MRRTQDGATGVYERVGMRIVNAWDQWERPTNRIALSRRAQVR